MKKALLALSAVVALSASAVTNQYTPSPGEGALNPTDYPGGIGSIELNCTCTINRECTGFATLSKGSTVIKSIPASNKRMVYTFDGFTKTEVGQPHITFFNELKSPAAEPGDYTVVIPSNFILVNGVGNTPMEFHYTVSGSAVKLNPIPADQATIPELTSFQIRFDNASKVNFTGSTSSIYLDVTDPTNDENTFTINCTGVEVDGNVATVTFDPYTTEGQVFINIDAGVFVSTIAATGKTEKNAETMVRYFIAKSVDGFNLTPAPSTISLFKPYASESIPSQYEGQDPTLRNYYFDLKLPEGCKFTSIASRKTMLKIEKADGTLAATSYNFNNWIANDDKNEAQLYLIGEDNKELKVAPGKYYLVIPANSFFYLAPDAAAATPNRELKFGPWIVEGTGASYTVSPAADEPVTSLSEIVITFDEGATVNVNKIGWFTLNNGPIEYDMRGIADGNKVIITIDPAIDVVGEYTLVSEASNINVNGANTPVEATFTVERGFINEVTILNNDKLAKVEIVEDEDFGKVWMVEVETALPEGEEEPDFEPAASITFELPYGYDSVYAMENTYGLNNAQMRITVDQLTAAGLKKLENNTLSGLTEGSHIILFTYVDGNEALEPSYMQVDVKKNALTGVNTINVEEEAEYYTLQGVKVANPEKGIYIKVVNGKASKVNL